MKPVLAFFISVLTLLSSMPSSSQNIEIFGGVNKNHFFGSREGHFIAKYTSDNGYLFNLGINDIKVYPMRWRFTLGYERYGGELEANNGGLGSGYSANAVIDKSILSVGFFPVDIRIIKRIDVNLGIQYCGLISENFSGTYSSWSLGSPDHISDLNEMYEEFSAKSNWGLVGRIAYDIKLSDKLSILPQYAYYFGLFNEFNSFAHETRSMRHQFGVGIQRKLKK